jgi:hypothetical protein
VLPDNLRLSAFSNSAGSNTDHNLDLNFVNLGEEQIALYKGRRRYHTITMEKYVFPDDRGKFQI